MSTIKDVARLANVSVATVSRVMNNSPKASAASREVVQKAMAELGYTPNANARALVSQTCDTMGVVVGDVADPFFGALVKGVAGVAVEQGLHLLMGNGFHRAQQEREAIDLLIGKRCGAHTFPYIEVKNPGATVEHEATTSKISDDQMFYCRSRGISEEDAVSLIVDGFCKQVFRELPMEFAVEAKKLLEVSLEGSVG